MYEVKNELPLLTTLTQFDVTDGKGSTTSELDQIEDLDMKFRESHVVTETFEIVVEEEHKSEIVFFRLDIS